MHDFLRDKRRNSLISYELGHLCICVMLQKYVVPYQKFVPLSPDDMITIRRGMTNDLDLRL